MDCVEEMIHVVTFRYLCVVTKFFLGTGFNFVDRDLQCSAACTRSSRFNSKRMDRKFKHKAETGRSSLGIGLPALFTT